MRTLSIMLIIAMLEPTGVAAQHKHSFTPQSARPLAAGVLSSLAETTPLPDPGPPPARYQVEQQYPTCQKEQPLPTFMPVNRSNAQVAQGVTDLPFKDQPASRRQSGQLSEGFYLPASPVIPLLSNMEGISNVNLSPNPDTDGEVGPNHYVQMVKYAFAIWDKNGTLLYGPANTKTLWNNVPGPWNNLDYYTDPIVVYDHLADRWLVSAMVYDIPVQYFEMIAVSQTSDPTGGWNCYVYEFNNMPDYPKFGVWPDGYYMTVNEAAISPTYVSEYDGLTVMVFNKEDMGSGITDPRSLLFHVPPSGPGFYSNPSCFLPADLDGPPPPAGTPNYLACIRDDQMGYPTDQLWIWKCTVDWSDSLKCRLEEDTILMVEPFTGNLNDFNASTIRQPNTDYRIFTMGDRLMHRLQYRNFGSYQTMVTCHTIQETPNEHAAKRWYEIRRQDDSWMLFQQGTYCPDADDRWMGSVAMDVNGNIALGYSVSGDTAYPSIRVTGRKAEDPLNLMTFTEQEIMTGSGNQLYNNRWGDYSCMTVDPSDELVFWYTQQYIQQTGNLGWSTRIASFRLDTAMVSVPGVVAASPELSLFPNPSPGNINIRFTLGAASPVTISITNMFGKTCILYSSPGMLNKGGHTITFMQTGVERIPLLSPGLALITLTTGHGITTGKIMLTR